MDAQEQLLLSEGVCRQLNIVTYHPSIEPSKVPDKDSDGDALVSTVWVCLVQSLRLPPHQGAVVPVCYEENVEQFQQLLVEAEQEFDGLIIESVVIMPQKGSSQTEDEAILLADKEECHHDDEEMRL